VSNPDAALFYYLEKGPEFADDFVPLDGEWTSLLPGHCVVPETVRLESGSEPGKLVFSLYADPVEGPQGVFPPISSVVTYAQRPDGQYNEMTLPAFNGEPLKPFTTIRLRESATEADVSESDSYRFVGALLACELDLATESWLCTALEIPRWRMSKYVVRGTIWHNTNEADPQFYENTLPVFNAEGKRDMWVDNAGNRQLEFYHPDFKYAGVYWTAKWRLGDILNYLRKLYWEIVPATGLTILGIKGCSTYMNWPEVTTVTHPWLFETDGFEQVYPDFALGGMTLLEAIDTIIRKAGQGAEWTTTFDYDTVMWDLEFYDRNGTDSLTLSRGTMGATIGSPDDPPEISAGHVGYDWTDAADAVRVFGRPLKYECTIAYDPDNVMNSVFPDMIKIDWDATAQTNYTSAEIATDAAADTDFPSVFTKFRFLETKNWSAAFGIAGISQQGEREVLREMLTKAVTGGGEIQGKVWRWLRTDDGTPIFMSQPETVSLTFNQDFSFSVHGHYTRDEVIPGTENDDTPKSPRFLCSIPADASPWSVKPFIITLAVYGDERAVALTQEDSPEDWPPHLEDTPDISKLENHWRYKVLHFLDADGKPTEDNPVSTQIVSVPTEKVLDNQNELDAIAIRRRRTVERPMCEGALEFGGNLHWAVVPGLRLDTITGGGAPKALSTLSLGVPVKSVTVLGLGTRTLGERSQRVELSNG